MMQTIELTAQEKFAMYMKLSKPELIKMLLENQRLLHDQKITVSQEDLGLNDKEFLKLMQAKHLERKRKAFENTDAYPQFVTTDHT